MWLRSLYYIKKTFDTIEYSDEEISEFQVRTFGEIMDSGAGLPFYSERWPDNVDGLEEISELPVIDADTFREEGSGTSRLFDDGRGGIIRTSSGTGGSPAEFRFTEQAHDWLSAIAVRTLYLQGYRPRQRIAQYWGGMRDQRTWIGEQLIPKRFIEPGTSPQLQADMLADYGPEVLKYFPHALMSLCKVVRAGEIEDIQPDLILTYGEPLTPAMREYIEDTFDAPVYDQYATTEFGVVAWECQEGVYHVAEDAVHMEIVDAEGDRVEEGKAGRVALTGLVNTDTPLVRYAIGDIAEPAEPTCSCETSFRGIERIRGREKDIFLDSEEEPVFPDQVMDIVSPAEGILSYQLVAEDDRYLLRYIPNSMAGDGSVGQVAEKLESELSLSPVELEEVEDLPRSRGGKINIIENNQSGAPFTGKIF